MMLTILLYSFFTGLSALSVGFWDFALYRFLTGLGVGGEFAVGVSLVAEVMPDRARPFALGLLQALSAVGNITAAVIEYRPCLLGSGRSDGRIVAAYVRRRCPACPAFRLVFLRLKEPERWQVLAAKHSMAERLRSYFGELFQNPRWTKNALIGLLLASSGIIGLWGIGFFSIDLSACHLPGPVRAARDSGIELTFQEDIWAGWTSVMLNIGAFFGIYAFSRAHPLHRPAAVRSPSRSYWPCSAPRSCSGTCDRSAIFSG